MTSDSTNRYHCSRLYHCVTDMISLKSLKSIEASLENLRTSSVVKPKFAFKRKVQKPSSAPSPSVVSSDVSGLQEKTTSQAEAQRPSSSASLSGHRHQYLSRASIPALLTSATDLSISDLDMCIIDLQDVSSDAQPLVFNALHMRNVHNTVLLLPSIHGSAMIHDMQNCVAVLSCHQVCSKAFLCPCFYVDKLVLVSHAHLVARGHLLVN